MGPTIKYHVLNDFLGAKKHPPTSMGHNILVLTPPAYKPLYLQIFEKT